MIKDRVKCKYLNHLNLVAIGYEIFTLLHRKAKCTINYLYMSCKLETNKKSLLQQNLQISLMFKNSLRKLIIE